MPLIYLIRITVCPQAYNKVNRLVQDAPLERAKYFVRNYLKSLLSEVKGGSSEILHDYIVGVSKRHLVRFLEV